ncbi:relaxase/mobilization nuclease domain-containing protein [Elizabethkingia ursingii]|uniref:conjugal transfer protein MobB n=1 Tax=Elizabethkingia ursingii TaxID=1756150 RepID=UPI002012E30B|nr:conjugal transfer protein MobB [Elizabethkingia ursingii]MCL1665815.1 relaxase/mobilization nuclease domain-containing protein [Elizabethkingia ursingii]
MIAKIGRSTNLYGALAYNQLKVEEKNAKIILTHKMIETYDGHYSVSQLARSFQPYLMANRNTEKLAVHISLNPDPKDHVSEEMFKNIAKDYMQEMGYGNQPFVVFKHSDIERSHIHIVSVGVDEGGHKISDRFEKRRSMNICREIEQKYNLTTAIDKKQNLTHKVFSPVKYDMGQIKSQMAGIIRHISKYYKFQSLGEYNALLSLFNITTERIQRETNGKLEEGLLYFALNEMGNKAGPPFKASLFGKNAGLSALEEHFLKSKDILTNHPDKKALQSLIRDIVKSVNTEVEFRKQLAEKGIDLMIRRNDAGRLYGITFIDHHSKTVWNGSRLGKEFSANTFNDYWNNKTLPKLNEPFVEQPKLFKLIDTDIQPEKPHQLFDFISIYPQEESLLGLLGSLIPETNIEDYEEIDFANRMKKKKYKRRKNR